MDLTSLNDLRPFEGTVLLTPAYPDTYTAFANNASRTVIVKNKSGVWNS